MILTNSRRDARGRVATRAPPHARPIDGASDGRRLAAGRDQDRPTKVDRFARDALAVDTMRGEAPRVPLARGRDRSTRLARATDRHDQGSRAWIARVGIARRVRRALRCVVTVHRAERAPSERRVRGRRPWRPGRSPGRARSRIRARARARWRRR